MVSLDQFVVWLIIGLIGGSVARLIIKRERKGLGLVRNLALGLVGAFVGGLLFRLLGLFRELDKVIISLRDVVAAVVGSLLVIAALWLWQRWLVRSEPGKRNPHDLATRPYRLIAPAMQQAKQPFGTRLQLLARLTPNAGKHTANQPTRLAHPGFLCRRSRGLGEMTPRTPRVKLFGEVATCLVPGFQVRNPPAR